MDVPVSTLRAELKQWIDAARAGEDVVVTERGVPVARLTGVASADLLTQLLHDGLLTAPDAPRPVVEGDERPGARSATGVSGLVRRLRR